MVNFNSNSNLPAGLRRKLEEEMAHSPAGDLSKINEVMQAHADDYNRTPQAELQGYSPEMCHALRHEWNTPHSPIQFNATLSLQELSGSSIFQQLRTVLLAVRDAEGVKTTASGNFNRKFVEAMVEPLLNAQDKEELLRYNKVLNEPDFGALHKARIVANAAGLLVKRKGIIRIARKHQALLEKAAAGRLYTRLFDAYFRKYNVGYLFRYRIDVDWIQHEIRFLLYPLSLKARKWINMDVLAQEILHPMTLENLRGQLSQQQFLNESSIIEHYFVRSLYEWGLLKIQWSDEAHYPSPRKVKLSPLFNKFIHFNQQPVEG